MARWKREMERRRLVADIRAMVAIAGAIPSRSVEWTKVRISTSIVHRISNYFTVSFRSGGWGRRSWG